MNIGLIIKEKERVCDGEKYLDEKKETIAHKLGGFFCHVIIRQYIDEERKKERIGAVVHICA